MNEFFTRESLGDGVFFTTVKTDRFHTSRLTVQLLTPLTRKTATVTALLSFLLRKGCRAYPDVTALNRHLDELYGAVLDTDVRKVGGWQSLVLTGSCINNRFALGGEDIVAELARLMGDMLTHPTALTEREIAVESKILKETIESVKDDKAAYVMEQLMAQMFAGDPRGVFKYGYVEDLKTITPAILAARLKELLSTARVEIIGSGRDISDATKTVFRDLFSGVERRYTPLTQPGLLQPTDTVQTFVEPMDTVQSKLAVGMTTTVGVHAPDRYAMTLLNSLYGASMSSRLFLTVREKLSLCYYCASSLELRSGYLVAYSGMEEQNRQKTLDAMRAELHNLQNGEVTDEELTLCKLEYANSLSSMYDSLTRMEGWVMGQIINETAYTPEQEMEKLSAVTVDEVVSAAQKLREHTVSAIAAKEVEA